MGAMQQMMMANSGGSGLPLTRVYTTGTGATETAPTGATNVVIGVWGGGSSGGKGPVIMCIQEVGRGGHSGAYSQTSVAISAGQTLTYTVGAGGATTTSQIRNVGGASSCSSGTKTITTMTANGGPVANSTAATASGGTALNTSGNIGENAQLSGTPGVGITGTQSEVGGGGGIGGNSSGSNGQAGDVGKVVFYYT